ncbi:MAG: FliM/FliN family flagellar motor switch protein [Candidatus Marinamargulisbacteria bacterium]
MTTNPTSTKKEIFLPSIIGDWTTYTAEKNKAAISITKSIGHANKTLPESTIQELLFFHHIFFESFFDQLIHNLDSHIVIDTISANVINHTVFKESQKADIYISKFQHPELDQIDFILSKKATKFIAHRLCGGAQHPNNIDPTDIEISIISIITDLFFNELSNHWRTIFEYTPHAQTTQFGDYTFHPQQYENEAVLEITARFKLFNQTGMTCKLLYSLKTINVLLDYMAQLNDTIIERAHLNKKTLKKTMIDAKSVIGTTPLSLNELQTLEIGDVVVLEDKQINDPITLTIGNKTKFNVKPVQIDEKTIGVQLVDFPMLESHINDTNKPLNGPLIESKHPLAADSMRMGHGKQAISSTTDHSIENSLDDDPTMDDSTDTPSYDDTDDFSWDDLDDE